MLAGIGAIGTVAAIIAGVVIAVREGQGYHPAPSVLTSWCVVGCSGFVMVVTAVITAYFASQSIDNLLERGMDQ